LLKLTKSTTVTLKFLWRHQNDYVFSIFSIF